MLSSTGKGSLAYARIDVSLPAPPVMRQEEPEARQRTHHKVSLRLLAGNWRFVPFNRFFDLTQVGINRFCLSKVLDRL